MEQNYRVYEFQAGNQVFTFEAPTHQEAEHHKPYAILHFKEILGQDFKESDLTGPVLKAPHLAPTALI